jgi:hypothetical protein
MFYRVKAPLISAVVVGVVTAASAFYVTDSLRARAAKQLEDEVLRAQQVLLRQTRLEGFDLANLANGFAREDELVQIFSKPTPDEQNRAAFIAVEARKARVEHPGGDASGPRVGILGVVDAKGALIARDLRADWRHGEVLSGEFPSLDIALKGTANKDVWNMEGAMYRVGAASIKGPQGNVLGAVFIGFVQSTPDAVSAEQLLGAEVAYLLDGKIHASSFEHHEGGSESEEEKALAAQLFDGPRLAEKAVAGRQATPVFHVKLGREEWLGAAAPLPGNATQSKSGFVVLRSLKEAQAHVAPITGILVGIGVVAVLMILAAWQMTERRFFIPLDRIEAGVSEVINGNQDYVFEATSEDFEGLANLLNGMIARLLGRPEPDADEEQEEKVSESLSQMP